MEQVKLAPTHSPAREPTSLEGAFEIQFCQEWIMAEDKEMYDKSINFLRDFASHHLRHDRKVIAKFRCEDSAKQHLADIADKVNRKDSRRILTVRYLPASSQGCVSWLIEAPAHAESHP